MDLQLTEKIVVVTGAASWSPDPPAPRSTTGRAASATRPPRCGAGITPGSARSNDGQMRPVDDAGSGLSGGGWWARQVCSAVPLTASAKAWGSR
jgi:hypothetical protein